MGELEATEWISIVHCIPFSFLQYLMSNITFVCINFPSFIEWMNKQIDNVKVVYEDWRKLNRFASFETICLVSSNILYPLLHTCIKQMIFLTQIIIIIVLCVGTQKAKRTLKLSGMSWGKGESSLG